VRRRQEEGYEGAEHAQAEQAASQPGAAAEPAATTGPSPEAIEQLKEAAALKDQGILTEEEPRPEGQEPGRIALTAKG
jgi:hypothetical protein